MAAVEKTLHASPHTYKKAAPFLQVEFPYGDQVHEVYLPPRPAPWPQEDDEQAAGLEAEAVIVLQCLTCKGVVAGRDTARQVSVSMLACAAPRCSTSPGTLQHLLCSSSQPLSAARVVLELQHALAASGLPHVPILKVPSFAAELHGSFGGLVAQLQECVNRRYIGEAGRFGETGRWLVLLQSRETNVFGLLIVLQMTMFQRSQPCGTLHACCEPQHIWAVPALPSSCC